MASSPAVPFGAMLPELSPPMLEKSGYTRESGRTIPNGTSDYSSNADNSLHCRTVAAKYEEFINPCVLSWTDLSYAVPGQKSAKNPYGKKLILDNTVYCGSRPNMIPHFASIGFSCPKYMNPAEYFVNLVNTDFEDHVDITKLVYAYAQSNVKKQLLDQLSADRVTLQSLPDIELRPSSAMRQFKVLMYRNTLNNIRNPGIYWIRLFMYFCLSFMVGTMYLSTNNELTEEDLVPLLFYVQAFLVFMSVAVLPFFIEQRAVFARERANSSLSVVSYVCANFLATLPGIFVIAVMSTALVVLLAGLNAFEYFLLNLFLSLVVSESMMHVIGSAVPHYIIGIALGAGVFGMFMLCEGFMVPRASIPDYWIWGYYLAFHSYSFESFVFKQFENETSDAAKAILVKYGMENVDVMQDMLYLAAYIVGFQIIFMFILWKYHTGRR
ncbi:hypothetical protein PRNP1_009708 [Phytophthora ramorum]